MSLLGPGQASIVCPQCKIVLPFNQTVCYNCGLTIAHQQSDNSPKNAHVPSSNGSQFRGPQISLVDNSAFRGSQTPSLLSGARWGSPPRTPSLLSGTQLEGPQTPALLNSVQASWPSGIQLEGPQTPALLTSVQVPLPGTVAAGSVQAALANGVPARSAQIFLASGKRKDRSHSQKRATLIYFLSVILVIVIGTAVGLNATGISLTALTSHTVTSSVLKYRVPKIAPLFADSFVNDALGWNLQSAPGNYGVTIGNGALTLAVEKKQLLWEPLPGAISYGNFTLAVDATLTKGDQNNGYGVYIRGVPGQSSDLAAYYRFELYGDASYALFKGAVDQNGKTTTTKLVNYTLSSAIQKQGRPNHIMIFANDASMSFIVNGHLLKTITDASYATGSIALFASNLPESRPGIEVKFSQFALYPMQLSLPS